MDLNPNDVGHETRVFQLTSPTLNATLKICIGRPFDENGMDRYNVYEVNKKGDQVERLRGYYLLDKGKDPMDTDKDFNIKDIGEPTWISLEGVVAPSAPKKSTAVAKSTYLVMEDTNSDGDCFYDALLRAKSGNPTVKSTAADIQAERRRIGEMFLKPGQAQKNVLDMYKLYKSNKDIQVQLERYGKQMQDIPEFAPFYAKLADVDSDKLMEAKNKIMEESDSSLVASDWDLFDELNGTDTYPVKEEDKMALELLSEYFDKNVMLSDQDAMIKFVANVNTMKKWVNELIVMAVQDNDNIQVLPLVKRDESDVESYTFTNTILVKPMVNGETKYMMAEYTPLTHFKLISFQDNDQLKSLVVYDELPASMKEKLNDNSAYRKALEKMPEPVPEVDVGADADAEEEDQGKDKGKEKEKEKDKLEEVPPESAPPVIEVDTLPDLSAPSVPAKKQTKRKKEEKDKDKDKETSTKPVTLKLSVDEDKQLKKDKDGIPPFTEAERTEINAQEFKTRLAKVEYMIANSGWGKYCKERFRQSTGNVPSNERLNTIVNSDNKKDYQTISGIFTMARP
jgi:hypothetical protein